MQFQEKKRLQDLIKVEKILQNIYYTYQFIDNARCIGSLLSNPVNNLSEVINKIKCKYGHNEKKLKLAESHTKFPTVFLNTKSLKMI